MIYSLEYSVSMSEVELVSPVETSMIFNKSGLVSKMGPKNLKARGVKTKNEYKEAYKNGLLDWNEVSGHIRKRVIRLMLQAKHHCKRSGFDSLGEMKWRVTLSGRRVENGWAHTVGDVMIIPAQALESRPDGDLMRLFVHEAVHVAQRKDHQGALKLVSGQWGFAPISDKDMLRIRNLGEARVNPDTDGEIYELDGRICHPVFTGTPSTLADVQLKPETHHVAYLKHVKNHEHPFEIMAELVAQAVFP